MPTPTEEVAGLLTLVIRGMVRSPNEVQILPSPAVDGNPAKLDIRVAPSDVGRIIGPKGRTARAIRTIFNTINYNHGVELELEMYGTKGREGD